MLVRDGVIADVAWGAPPAPAEGASVVDCGGQVLAPGLVDMRAFIGEPGAEHRETFEDRKRGGGGGRRHDDRLACRTPTRSSTIRRSSISSLRRARDTAIVNIHPAAALTKGLARPRDDRDRAA